MNNFEELVMWKCIFLQMDKVPNDYRSQYFTQFYNEIASRVIEMTLRVYHEDREYHKRQNETY